MNATNISPLKKSAPLSSGNLHPKGHEKTKGEKSTLGAGKDTQGASKLKPHHPATKVEAQLKTPEKQQTKEVHEYLQAINRLEQGLSSGKITPEQLDQALNSLEDKLSALSPENKKKLMGMGFFVKHKIQNIRAFRATLSDQLNDPKKRSESIDFLKDQQFVALLHQSKGTEHKPVIYDHTAKTSEVKPIPHRAIKA